MEEPQRESYYSVVSQITYSISRTIVKLKIIFNLWMYTAKKISVYAYLCPKAWNVFHSPSFVYIVWRRPIYISSYILYTVNVHGGGGLAILDVYIFIMWLDGWGRGKIQNISHSQTDVSHTQTHVSHTQMHVSHTQTHVSHTILCQLQIWNVSHTTAWVRLFIKSIYCTTKLMNKWANKWMHE